MWLRDYVEAGVAPTTQASYRDTIRVHLAPTLGHAPLARLTPQAIQGYISDKSRQGLSPTTVRYHVAIVDLPRKARREIHVWDSEQVRLFLAEAKRGSPYYRLYLAAITTGMRQGELLGLRWQDLDLVAGVASVQQTLYRLGKTLLVKEPKSNRSRRTVALAPILVKELRCIQDEQVARLRELGDAYQNHGLVFCQPNGKPLHAHNIVQRDFRQAMKRAGVPRIRFHDLRTLSCHATAPTRGSPEGGSRTAWPLHNQHDTRYLLPCRPGTAGTSCGGPGGMAVRRSAVRRTLKATPVAAGSTLRNRLRANRAKIFDLLGGDERIRTADLLSAIQALSQLSYVPTYKAFRTVTLPYCIRFHGPLPRVESRRLKSYCEAYRQRIGKSYRAFSSNLAPRGPR